MLEHWNQLQPCTYPLSRCQSEGRLRERKVASERRRKEKKKVERGRKPKANEWNSDSLMIGLLCVIEWRKKKSDGSVSTNHFNERYENFASALRFLPLYRSKLCFCVLYGHVRPDIRTNCGVEYFYNFILWAASCGMKIYQASIQCFILKWH